jgi:mono/diheme cytochrome c family protein
MQLKTSRPRHETFAARLCAALAIAAVLACSSTSYAQEGTKVDATKVDETKEKAGLSVWRSSGCSECHGAFANGEKERDEAPSGANLRQTRLDDATIAETVRCGRPGAGMPSFGSDAYKERGCYGQPAGPPPDDLYPSGRTLSAQEIDDVVTYLRARIVGKRAVTPEECAWYYGEQASSFCDEPK